LADELVVVDQSRNSAWTVSLDFTFGDETTKGLSHDGISTPFTPYTGDFTETRDTPEGEFTKSVVKQDDMKQLSNILQLVNTDCNNSSIKRASSIIIIINHHTTFTHYLVTGILFRTTKG